MLKPRIPRRLTELLESYHPPTLDVLPQDVPPHLVLARLRLPGPRLRVVALGAQPDHPPRRRVLDRTHQRFHFEVQLRFLFLRTSTFDIWRCIVFFHHVLAKVAGVFRREVTLATLERLLFRMLATVSFQICSISA